MYFLNWQACIASVSKLLMDQRFQRYLVWNEAEIVFYACGLRHLNLKQVQDCSTAVNSWDLETPPGSIVLPPLSCETGSCDYERSVKASAVALVHSLCGREVRLLGKGYLRDLQCLLLLLILMTLLALWHLVQYQISWGNLTSLRMSEYEHLLGLWSPDKRENEERDHYELKKATFRGRKKEYISQN